MKILVLGAGNVGRAVAAKLKKTGHEVVVTTTSENKVTELEDLAEHVFVLKGHESEKVLEAAKGCEAVIVCVAPSFKGATSSEDREKNYHQTLVMSCQNARNACEQVIFCSSFSVYGSGGEGVDPITEDTEIPLQAEPSAKYYYMAENEVLKAEMGCVLRFPDMYGAPKDHSYCDRLRLAHKFMGGKVPFSGNSPLYRLHYLDVTEALCHAVEESLSGVYNVCDNGSLPKTNKEIFDELADSIKVPRLQFLDQIVSPNRKISSQKIIDTGFNIKHTDQNGLVLEELGNLP